MPFDFHTHDLMAPPGEAIVNVPREWLDQPELFSPRSGVLYSAGIHPWWTAEMTEPKRWLDNLRQLLTHEQTVALGECGLDALRGAAMDVQEALFERQIALAEALRLPVTLHVVRAYDRLLKLRKRLQPTTQWTVHGFRGGAALARQLLQAGMDLSFGEHYNPEAYALTPPERRHRESDDTKSRMQP